MDRILKHDVLDLKNYQLESLYLDSIRYIPNVFVNRLRLVITPCIYCLLRYNEFTVSKANVWNIYLPKNFEILLFYS